MKYSVVAVFILLMGCDEMKVTSVEEYTARTKYCEDNGFAHKSEQNGAGHTWVYCVKDGKKFQSKWDK